MAKISFTFIFTLILIITAISTTSGAMTCSELLEPNECNLSWCRSNCDGLYHGIGFCVGPYPHHCVCLFNCPR
ncbi:hypothetical protein PHAVU_011G150800 [Phaseolus vulgaris]|uniref:Knottin scorpion toxin-like domain-containing protein n=1 Tax=Phaseolus vulgaris TaxID=3885 RepID=V7AIK2_PHAVU|nr:hypothetical protein PHAVU_011G150800g [Phaseolus vulgaris]ESW05085.1 hypothetical protein PHAVU_011G150800g [Phaseolus vulgaris]